VERRQQIRTSNWNNELLKKDSGSGCSEVIHGREKDERNFEFGFSVFFLKESFSFYLIMFWLWRKKMEWTWLERVAQGRLPLLEGHSFQSFHPSYPRGMIQEAAVTSVRIDFEVSRIGPSVLMFKLILHLKLTCNIQPGWLI
jgi:hypothetical protein